MNRSLPAGVLAALLLAACSHASAPSEPAEGDFAQAMNTYLAKRGDLCLNRSSWPVDVTREEAAQGSRNSVQLPVLQKLGLVTSTLVETETGAGDEPRVHTQARRYQLTDAGRQYYLAREPHKRATEHPQADHDFCAARLTLRKVVAWEKPSSSAVGAETVVSYTYDVKPAPWAEDAGVRQAFPMVDRVLRGAGVAQLKEAMVLTGSGWEARDL